MERGKGKGSRIMAYPIPKSPNKPIFVLRKRKILSLCKCLAGKVISAIKSGENKARASSG